MIKELTNAVTIAVKKRQTRVLDLYHNDACVGVWENRILPQGIHKETYKEKFGLDLEDKTKGIIMSKGSTLRKVAEKNKCEGVRIFWETTELEFYKKHEMFKKIDDIIKFLNSLSEETMFYLHSNGKCYPAEDCLLFNVQNIWLKFRADFSMQERPFASIMGELTIKPHGDKFQVFWVDTEQTYPQYRQVLRLKDMNVVEACEVTAELL